MRCSLALCWLCSLFVLASPATSQVVEVKPFERIAVIVLDDVGVDMLSCYGEGADTPNTPNICDLAKQGVLFRNAWANPTCSPTRATVQTGRYSFRTGVTGPGVVLPDEELTIPEVLADPINEHLGFNTAAVGKWHLSGGNFSNPPTCPSLADPRDQGYGRGAGTASNINNYFNWCRTFDGVTEICTAGGTVPECTDQPYSTIVNTDDALRWLAEKRAGPRFLWMAFNAPHAPFQAPPDDCPDGPCHGVTLPPGIGPGDVCPSGEQRTCYKAMLETLDTEVGRLLAALPPETAVIVMGDNGSPGQVVVPPFNPSRAKFTLYEGGINVPLILRAPGLVTPGIEVDYLVNTTDLFATVLDLAGAEIPPGLVHDSVSLIDVLLGQVPPRSYVFAERGAGSSLQKTARGARYKLKRMPNSTSENIEFFDLLLDPFETVDLYDDAMPSLTPEQQAAFDDLQEYFDFLDGTLGLCPATRSCSAGGGGCARAFPPVCTFSNTGDTACVQADGSFFQCGPEQSIQIRNCQCEVIVLPQSSEGGTAGPQALAPVPICFREDQSFFCAADLQ